MNRNLTSLKNAEHVEIGPVDEAELAELSQLAVRAKSHWDYPADLIVEWIPELTLTPESVQHLDVGVARIEGTAIGFYAVEFDDDAASLEHLWVDPGAMGIGLGRLLVRHALRRIEARGHGHLLIDSDPYAEGFYRRMGAVRVGSLDAPIPGDERRVLPQMRLCV